MDAAAVAAIEYAEYIMAVAEQRRRDNQTDDLIGTLVHAEIEGDRLDESSIIYESLLILIGGDETTRHVISGGMYELLTHPDQYALLAAEPRPPAAGRRGDAALGDADQEHGPHGPPATSSSTAGPSPRATSCCCSTPPPTGTSRSSTTPRRSTSPGPRTTTWPSASAPTSASATAWPAMELQIMFDRLFDRLPDLALATDAEPPKRNANFVSGYEEMPVTFTPTAPVGATA